MLLSGAMLATVSRPEHELGIVVAVVALIAALVSVFRKKVAAVVGWLLLSGFCAWVAKESAPLKMQVELGVDDCRAVYSAQKQYAEANGGFFGQLSCLQAPSSCGWPAGTTPFLDAQLASLTTKQGYLRSFVPGGAGKGDRDPGIKSFVYIATPRDARRTGNRGYAVDHTGLICFTTDGTAPPIVNGALSPACSPLK